MAESNLKPLLVVEDNPGVQKQLKWCFEGFDVQFASDRTTAINQLRRHEPPWDIVFLDPPFSSNKLTSMLRLILASNSLGASSIVYFEHARSEPFAPEQPWSVYREARAGDTHFGLLIADASSLSP